MLPKGRENVDWINLAHDRVQLQAFVDMKPSHSADIAEVFVSLMTASFSRRTLLRGLSYDSHV
jgi:hypothetical protein